MRFCWAQYAFWAVVVAFGVMSMLAGCGAKGELYLPPDDTREAAAAPTPSANNSSSTQ